MLKRILAYCIALIMVIPMGVAVIPETVVNAAINTDGGKTVNLDTFQCVPAPGEVTIDGDFSEGEWDWSGRLIGYDNIDYIDTYKVEVASMWDSKNLYMGFKFTDNSPMINIKDPELEPTWTWVGDSIQLRTITDRSVGWMTVSYYQVTDVGSLFYEFINENDRVGYITEPGSSKLNKINLQEGEPKKICLDAEVKYKRWEDNKGYNVELKIPFTMMFMSSAPKTAGTTFNLGVECYWCDMTGDSYREHWEFLQGGGASNAAGWKPIELLATGNVPLRQYVHDDTDKPLGTIHIPVKVPKQAKKITLVVEDKKGTRIANAVNEWTVDEKSIIGEENGYYIVDTLWNGEDLNGYMVAPGEYTVKGIWHEGIVPYFDEAAYNPGNPPWPDSTGEGSWASDHHPPVAITSIGNKVYIGSENCESGTGIFMIDDTGKKLWSIKRGAHMLASNDEYVYALPGNDFYADTTKGNTYIMRLDAETGNFAPFIDEEGNKRKLEYLISDILNLDDTKYMPRIEGFAANNDYLALATANDDPYSTYQGSGYIKYGEVISILDPETAELKKRIAVDKAGRLAFGKNGLLYAVTDNKIAEINPKTGKVTNLPIVAQEGEEFKDLAVDNDGNIVIYERTDRQLKVYNKSGKKLYEIGTKGGRAITGWWDENGLTHQVSALTVDSNGWIWVAEEWNYPRRVSAWNKDGLVKDFIGGPGYMAAGGALHSEDAEKVYCGPNEMILDRENHTYKMSRVLYVANWDKGQDFGLDVNGTHKITHFRTDASGEMKNYIYAPGARNGAILYKENEDGSFQPFWATGMTDNLFSAAGYGKYIPALDSCIYRSSPEVTREEVRAQWDTMSNRQYIWNDWNGDGAMEISECEFWNPNGRPLTLNGTWGGTITKNMEFIVVEDYANETARTPRNMYKVTPDYYREGGLPVYTWKSFKQIDVEKHPYDGDNILTDEGTIISVRDLDGTGGDNYYNGIKCVDPETGEDLWWYANPYAGVHGAQRGPTIEDNGAVVGPIKVMGTIPVERGGEVFCMRGYLGEDYLFTTDGYFVQTLFRDGRIPMLKLPDNYEDAIGLDMSKYSENGEPWSGTFVKHSDGVVRLLSSTAGPSIIICRVEGLDTITDIAPFNITVTKQMIDEAYAYNTAPPEEVVTEVENSMGYGIAKINKEMTINGETSDWVGVGSNLTIAKDGIEENGTATLAYDDENLYALFTINDNSPMLNNGNEYQKLFKTGDLCDIMINSTNHSGGYAEQGDMRISMGVFGGEPVAVLTKPVSDEKLPYRYASPVTTLDFDYVGLIEDAEVAIVRDTDLGMYILEAKLPLASLGMTATANKAVTGDVGIVISDEIGATNRARIYWSNKNTELVYDVPGEATLYPAAWDKMYFMP